MSRPMPVTRRLQSSDIGYLSGSPMIVNSMGGSAHTGGLSPYEARMIAPRTLSVSFSRKTSFEPENVLWKQPSMPGTRHHSSSLIEDPTAINTSESPVPSPTGSPVIMPLGAAPMAFASLTGGDDAPVAIEVVKSSFSETLINAINVLLGVGVLSLPYALSKGGWVVVGMLVAISCCAAFTAILLGRMQRDVVSVNHATTKKGTPSKANGHYTLIPLVDPTDEKERPVWEKGTWTLSWKNDKWWLQDTETSAGYVTLCNTSLKYPLRGDGNSLRQADWKLLPGNEDGSETITDETQLFKADSQGPVLGTLGTYPEIALAAFGVRGHLVLEVLFFLELYLFLVGSIILIVENVNHLTSYFKKAELTLFTGLLVLPPSMVTDFSKLSVLSYLGFGACVVLLFSMIYFAFATSEDLPKGSGNIVEHANDQSWFIFSTFSLGCSLVMSSFGGHSLFPSLRGDMAQPEKYPTIVYCSFLVTGGYYMLVVIFGYLMYGSHCNGIIVLNFDQGKFVTKMMLVCIVTVTYSKYGVINHALCCGIENSIYNRIKKTGRSVSPVVVQVVFRVAITTTAVGLTFVIPSFDTVMSLVGASISTVISIIFPCSAFLKLCGPRISMPLYCFNVVLVVIGSYFAVTGTMNTLGLDF